MDAVKDIPMEYLDFVYIDANHNYEYVLEDITEWSKRVKKGGIIFGDDYITGPGVAAAVDKYTIDNNIKFYLATSSSRPMGTWLWVK